MKVFLTGGTGFIGRLLTQSLLARGWRVVALVRQPDGPQARTLTKMGAQCVAGSSISYNFTSAKAQRKLGWTYRPAREMWSSIIDEELRLLADRKKRDLVSRLKPVETSK